MPTSTPRRYLRFTRHQDERRVTRVARFDRGSMSAAIWLLVACVLACVASGCASVKPIEREYLSQPIMVLDEDTAGMAAEQHWLETLEGSTGGYGGAAGGCACY